jgi:hypothetical protein
MVQHTTAMRSALTPFCRLILCAGLFNTLAGATEPGQLLIRTGTMLGEGILPEDIEKLSVAVSNDGLNWRRLFKKATLPDFSRDASVVRRGNEYVTVYTDAFNSESGTFGLARSTDLVNWTSQRVTLTGPAMSNTPNNTWAPEWFVDGDRYFVMVRSSQKNTGFTGNGNYAPPGIGWLECLDPGTWTNWSPFTPLPDLEPTYENDPFILKVGGVYHLFTDHYAYPGGAAILHRRSTEGPFTGYGPPVNIATNFAKAPAYIASTFSTISPWEGQFVLPLGGNRYRLYFQAVWYDASFAVESHDGLESWDMSSMQRLTYDGLPARGHGSVLPVASQDFQVPVLTAAKLAQNSLQDAQAALSVYNMALSEESRLAGQTDVRSNPTNYGLYTPQMITDLNLGGVMVQKTGSNAVVSLQLESTPDLSAPFADYGAPLEIEVDLPGDKHFLRIRALGPQ